MDSSSEPTDPGGTDPTRPADEASEASDLEGDSDTPSAGKRTGSKRSPFRIGAMIGVTLAAAVCAAVVVWLLVRNDDSSSSALTRTITTAATTPATSPSMSASPPRVTTRAELEGLSADGAAVYWAGPAETGYTLTVVRETNGSTYVRYLPPGVSITDAIPPSLVVATYPLKGALVAVKRAAKSPDNVSLAIANGGTAVYAKSKPTNVYFAFPESSAQIEVYDPSPGRALQLVTSGTITPVAP